MGRFLKCIHTKGSPDILNRVLDHEELIQSLSPVHTKYLNIFFGIPTFNNVTLLLDGNQTLGVNHSILAASSDYFKQRTRLDQFNLKDKNEINFTDYDPTILSSVVDFCYGKDLLSDTEVEDYYIYLEEMFKAAEYFVIPNLKTKILDYIVEKKCAGEFFANQEKLILFLPALLEYAIQKRESDLFNFSLRLVRNLEIQWADIPNCKELLIRSLKIAELQNMELNFVTNEKQLNTVYVNSEILTLMRGLSQSFNFKTSVYLGCLENVNTVHEFLAFLYGDSLSKTYDKETFYRLAEVIGVSLLSLPEFSPKDPSNLKILITYLSRTKNYQTLAKLAFDWNLIDSMVQIQPEIGMKLLQEIERSPNVDWLEKFLTSSHVKEFLSSSEAKKILNMIIRTLENREDLNRIYLRHVFPKLVDFLAQGDTKNSSHISDQVIKTLIKFTQGENYLPSPIPYQFLLDLFQVAEQFEIPLMSDYIQLMMNHPKVFTDLKEASALISRFPQADMVIAACSQVLNGLSELTFDNPNPETLHQRPDYIFIENFLREHGKSIKAYNPSVFAETKIGDRFIEEISSFCPNLKVLNLSQCNGVTPLGIKYLVQKLSLKNLALGKMQGCGKNEKIDLLNSLKTYRKLTTLNLTNWHVFTDIEMEQMLKDLNVVDLTVQVSSLTNQKYIAFFGKNKKLKKLDIISQQGSCKTTQLEKKGIKVIIIRFPGSSIFLNKK